jgi:hypothetical protein
MHNVALVFLGMTQIRERQAELIQSKLTKIVEKAKGRVARVDGGGGDAHVVGDQRVRALHARARPRGAPGPVRDVADLRRMLSVTKLDRALVVAEQRAGGGGVVQRGEEARVLSGWAGGVARMRLRLRSGHRRHRCARMAEQIPLSSSMSICAIVAAQRTVLPPMVMFTRR